MSSYYPQAGQQPQPPQQAAYPQQPQYGAPPTQQPGYAPQSQYQQPSAQQGGMPAYHDVNDEQMAQAYADSQQSNFGPQPQFLKVPGPRGQLIWDQSVPSGYMGYVYIRICSPWERGKPVFVQQKTHFYRSRKYPKGRVLHFQGEDSLFMQAITKAAQSDDARLQRVATDYGRVRTQYLYNVIDLSHPESHIGQDGVMRPYILSAGKQLNTEIGQLADHRGGISKFCHPVHGRALKLTKTKTGPETLNVEYGVMDVDPAPLDAYFHPILQNLWDLEAQLQQPTHEEVMEAIRELGLPPPDPTVQVPGNYGASYNPDPNPPHANPYGAPAPAQGAPQGQPPGGAPPPAYGAPAPAQGAPQGQPPGGAPPPAYGAPAPAWGAPQGQPPGGAPPPAYGAPAPAYDAPAPAWEAPQGQSPGGAPAPAYDAPAPAWGAPQGQAPGGAPPPYQGGQSTAPLPGMPPAPQPPPAQQFAGPPAQGGMPPAPNPPPMAPPPVQSGGAGPSPYPMQGGQAPN